MASPVKSLKAANEELPEEVFEELDQVSKEFLRAKIAQDITAYRRLLPLLQKRRELTLKHERFWPLVLESHQTIEVVAAHREDKVALSYLRDIWVERNPNEPRAFTLEFHFAENPYFSDSVLKKEFKYVPQPPEDTDEVPSSTPGDDGVSDAMVAFSWDRDVNPQAIKINWKSDSKNLTKLYPRQTESEDAEDIIEGGSFFNFFVYEDDPDNFAALFDEDIFPRAIDYFQGKGPNSVNNAEDETDEDDDDDDDEGSVDLEHPKKKLKKA